MNKFTAVILAAGMGSRLKHLTKGLPKPLVEVGGKSLIWYAISWAKSLGVSKIVVVGGYKFELLKEAVNLIDSSVVMVENEEYATTQRMVSLLKARGEVEGGLYVRDADYIFDTSLANKFKKYFDGTVIFGTGKDSVGVGLDMKVKLDDDGNLLDMSKELTDYDYFFCTQVFSEEKKVSILLQAGEDLIKEKGDGMVHVEDALLKMVKDGETVRFIDVGAPKWVEIDTIEEYERANELVSNKGENVAVELLQ